MKLALTNHAVDRWRERVKPCLDFQAAKADMQRAAQLGELEQDPPRWALAAYDADAFLQLADGICVPLVRSGKGYVAVTVIVRGGLPPRERRLRRAKRRAVRRWREARRRREGRGEERRAA